MTVVTTAQNIIDAAVKSSLLNDLQRTQVATDNTEMLNVLNRLIQRVYALAGMPREYGGMSDGDFFSTSTTITVHSSSPPSVPAAAFRHVFADADGDPVHVVTRFDVVHGRAELPPGVIVEQGVLRSAGRTGDPSHGEVLTVHYTPLPGTMTATGNFIGATTITDGTTSQWPEHVANPWLIAELRRYFAVKRGDQDQQEAADIQREIEVTGETLAAFVGINATELISSKT